MLTTPMESSTDVVRSAVISSSNVWTRSAFRFAGRFSTIEATPLSNSTMRSS
jgi:hypothetical protein